MFLFLFICSFFEFFLVFIPTGLWYQNVHASDLIYCRIFSRGYSIWKWGIAHICTVIASSEDGIRRSAEAFGCRGKHFTRHHYWVCFYLIARKFYRLWGQGHWIEWKINCKLQKNPGSWAGIIFKNGVMVLELDLPAKANFIKADFSDQRFTPKDRHGRNFREVMGVNGWPAEKNDI